MRILLSFFLALFLFTSFAAPLPAFAKAKTYRHTSTAAAPTYNPKYAAFLVDGDTGKILYQEDADKLRHPASLTKMMTLYLLFEALEHNRVDMDTKLKVTANAAAQAKTNLSMQEGDIITVREAMLAVIVKSANDAAMVVAENLAGNEDKFVDMMNRRAKQLGLKNTHFENPNGLHDPRQVTTAKDMALLGIALKKHFPEYFKYFSYREFTYNGVSYAGHNHVMENYPGADGLKTGFVNASGFNLVTTATRRGINLVGVVLGGRTHQSRDAQMVKLLDYGFQKAAAMKSLTYVASDYQTKNPDNNNYDDEGSDSAANDDTTPAAVTAPAPAPAPRRAPTPVAAPAPVPTPVAKNPVGLQPDAAIDQDETPDQAQGAPAKLESYENNTYVRAAPTTKISKSQRYKSNMIIQADQPAPLTGNASAPLFVPAPKDKPKI